MNATLALALAACTIPVLAHPTLAQADRVVVLVRHAERAAEPRADPPLSDAGRARAAALASALEYTPVGAAIVTPYRRTRETAEPIVAARGLTPVVVEVAGGVPAHAQAVADAVRAQLPGATVLVVGHSNTLPAIIAALGGPRMPDLCEAQYAGLFVLALPADGGPRLVRASYGAPDPAGASACHDAAPAGPAPMMLMPLDSARYGRPHPNAPAELTRFAFLLGRWRCDVRITPPGGAVQTFRGEWTGRYALDGYAIVDEYRQWDGAGTLVQLGQNIRSYDAARGRWVIRWHDALTATWLDLTPDDLGRVEITDSTITYYHHVPPGPAAALFPPDAVFRVSYEHRSPRRFTWRAAVSRDRGKTWGEIEVIDAERIEDP